MYKLLIGAKYRRQLLRIKSENRGLLTLKRDEQTSQTWASIFERKVQCMISKYSKYSSIQSIQLFKFSSIQVFKYSSIQRKVQCVISFDCHWQDWVGRGVEPMWIIGGYSPTNFCKYSKIKTKTKRKHQDANIGRWDKASNKDKRQHVLEELL